MAKRCTKCAVDKAPSEFYKDRSTNDGLARWCKDCSREYERSRHGTSTPKVRTGKAVVVKTAQGNDYIADRELLAIWQALREIVAADEPAGNLLFVGPSGSGKTVGAEYLAQVAGLPFVKVDAAAMTDPEAWFGTREVVVENGAPKTVYRSSAFVEALGQPCVLLIDEINRIRDEHRNILLPLLDTTRQVTNPLTGEIVVRHPNCFIIMSGNRGIQFTGTYAVDPALITRAYTVNFSYLEAEAEQLIAKGRTGCDDQTAALFVRFANEARSRAKTDPDFAPISTREVLMACRAVAAGTSADTAARVTIINAADDDGGAESPRAALEMIWTGIRSAK